MMSPLSLKGFFMMGGVILLLLGVVGFLGIFGPTTPLWLTDGENYAHVVLGAVALAALYVPGLNTALAPYLKWIAVLVGVIALFFGVFGFVGVTADLPPKMNTFGVAFLNNPIDNIIHLVVGAWALYVSLKVKVTA